MGDAEEDGQDCMDPIFDQALDYLDRFDRSKGLMIHLNRSQSSTMGQM